MRKKKKVIRIELINRIEAGRKVAEQDTDYSGKNAMMIISQLNVKIIR